MKVNRLNNACQNCDLTYSCFALGFDSEHLSALSHIIQESIEFKKGEMLYRQQEKFRGLFAVKQGGIKTFLISEAGEQVISGFYLPGEILGFDAVHAEQYVENAVALTNTIVCRIPFASLLELASKDQVVQRALFKLFSHRIKQIRQHFHFNAEQKMAAFLLDYARRLMRQEEDGYHFQLLPTQQDIASFLDLTPETVSRVFHKFLAMGVYSSDRAKQIDRLDHAKLEQLIQSE